MKIKTIRNIKNLAGKKVFLRLDLNVPISNGEIKQDYKISASLPTIRFLLRHNCRLIIATHLDHDLSVRPVSLRLAELLGRKVSFMDVVNPSKLKAVACKLKNQEIMLLQNLRFNAGEMKNDKKFARSLAALADLYVNDAFAVSHRDHASVSAIKKYLPAYGGLLLEKEVANLSKILKPKQPLISILGGAKLESKISLINNLAKKSERVLIGGALANSLIAAHGFKIGRSLADKSSLRLAAALIKKHKNLILPMDALVGSDKDSKTAEVRLINQIGKDEMILDIGPKTVKLFAGFIKEANTIIWSGPMGAFENEKFKHGSLAIARLIASRSTGKAFGAVGGGETVEALKLTKMEHYIDWVSTGGGAMLSFLGGEPMPGLKGIVK